MTDADFLRKILPDDNRLRLLGASSYNDRRSGAMWESAIR
jgi:hypothetical protein